MKLFIQQVLLLVFIFSVEVRAEGNKCITLFTKAKTAKRATSGANQSSQSLDYFLQFTDSDPYLRQNISYVEQQLRVQGQMESPISVSRKTNSFRKKILPVLVSDPNQREALTRFFEADLRLRSEKTKRTLRQNLGNYDVVIIGAGVHGVIAVQTLIREKPNLRILIVEGTDTAGANFRYPNNSFRINSSNRPSSRETLPLPGQGNINELPQLPIQVSDLTAVKYPTSGDLGTSLVAGLYAAVTNSKNVEVLFTSSLQTIDAGAFSKDNQSPFEIEIADGSNENLVVKTSALVLASGLGKPKIPDSVREKLSERLVESKNPFVDLPKVMTFETIMRILGQSPNPRALLEDKKIAIVGVGDSANVFIEFMLGYAAEKGYSYSNGQIKPPKKIFWVGQTRKTCDKFIADSRSRYAQIGTGFRSSDPNTEAIIEPIPQRLQEIGVDINDELVMKLTDVTETLPVDHVILATGYEGQLFKLFEELYRVSGQPKATRDSELLNSFFADVLQSTRITQDQLTAVARKLKLIDSNGQFDVDSDPRIIIVGPGAGKLPQDNELFGIIQNSVSIFNNALRTEAAARFLSTKIAPSEESAIEAKKLTVERAPSSAVIKNIVTSRPLATADELYLKATLVTALDDFKFQKRGEFKMTFAYDNRGLLVSSNYQVEPMLSLLAQTRDFYATLQALLSTKTDGAVAWQVKANVGAEGLQNLSFEIIKKPRGFLLNSNLVEIENASLPLSGPL